ncbi:MAG TPA: hypothetical protein VIF09_25640 [Polyangiaceae bacterium]
MPRAPAFLCVTIDCECDKGPGWRTRRPLAFSGVHVGIVERLHPLFQRLGAKPTYMLSPELLRDDACVERLGALDGCELATHLHWEMAEPGAHEPEETTAVQRDYPEDAERAKLEWLTGAFRSAFGRAPASFRAGRFGIGTHSVPILESLGYAVESSVTPHMDWSHVSRGLAFADAPTQPYHPDPRDPGRTGTSTLLEVPVTIRPRALGRVPFVGKLLEPRWLRPTRTSGADLVALARETVDAERSARPDRAVVLNAMFHNVEVVAGTSPYASTDDEARRIVERLATLLEATQRDGIRCVGLSDVPGLLA